MLPVKSTEVTSSPSAEGGEVSEMEIIANYKSENLFDSLETVETAEAETKQKEIMLHLADQPKIPDLNKLSERDECLEVMNKFASYQSLIEECLKAASNEIEARKKAVKELDNSCVFYDAQYRDVKKVANAYLLYGRRLKNVERTLFEKMPALLSQNENSSLCFSESSSCASSGARTRNSVKVSPSPSEKI